MHLLIATAFDPIPSDGIALGRYHFLAKAMMERGHQVTVLTSSFSHTLKKQRDNNIELIEGIQYLKIASPNYSKNLSLARLNNHRILGNNATTILNACHQAALIDLIVCATPPLQFAKSVLQWGASHKLPTVLDIQDAWPEAWRSASTLLYKLTLNAMYWRKIHEQNLELASAITSVAQTYLPENTAKPHSVFYLGAPCSEIPALNLSDTHSSNHKMNWVFLGNTGAHAPLLRFLNSAISHHPRVTYIGNCNDEKIKSHTLVNYQGPLYGSKLYEALNENDFGLFVNDDYKEIKLPNKLFYYWACGIPVLGIDIYGEAKALIEEMGGLVFNDSPIDFEKIKLWKANTNRNAIREKALQRFDQKIIYQAFSEFLETVLTNYHS